MVGRDTLKEVILSFGSEKSLVGVVTEPLESVARANVSIIVLNSGQVHRIGPHRMSVRMARELARKGIVTLRFDISGVGDSRVRSDHLPLDEYAILETDPRPGQ